MKVLRRIGFTALTAIVSIHANAQQDAMFTHYMYNTLAVNPAYAGSRDAMTATLLSRSQWVSFKGAPETQTFTLNTPLKSKNIGLGFSAINDKIGPVNNTAVYIDFAYILKLGEKSKLSFGLKGGINLMQANLSNLNIDNQTDVAFQQNFKSKLLPNFGFGMYYYRERFYAGISTPKLLQNNFQTNEVVGTTQLLTQQRHYFLIAGTVFRLTNNIDLKPTTFIKLTVAAPLEADITTSFIFDKRFLAGVMFRTGDALGVLVGYNITDQFYVGYSFDWSYGLKTFKYNSGTHEIMLRYDFLFGDKQKIRSPRYF